uniref:Palmitoyltransferase n=1 Tax=Trichobilharzia regenti TaxID=157069 RepID=A0AA85J861_TRIRE|nr:unnamed protein product [Trichobilharzia regenti]
MPGLRWLRRLSTCGVSIARCLLVSRIFKSRVAKNVITRLSLGLFTIYLLLFEIYLVLPSLFGHEIRLTYFILLVIYAFFYASVIKCIFVDPSIRGLLLSSKSKPDWSYCLTCQTVRPPRSHHCFDCGTCVLRRDHHCTIIAQCIGHANWRYFCNTLFYGMLGCIFMSYYNLQLIFQSDYFPLTWSIYYRLLCILAPPGFMWLTGYLTFLQSFIFLTTSLSFFTACLLCVFIIYQFNMMLCNQTMFERAFHSFSRHHNHTNNNDSSTDCSSTAVRTYQQQKEKEEKEILKTLSATAQQQQPLLGNNNSSPCMYNIGYISNIKQYLGERWILAFLCPLVNSPLTTDGLSYPISDGVKFK